MLVGNQQRRKSDKGRAISTAERCPYLSNVSLSGARTDRLAFHNLSPAYLFRGSFGVRHEHSRMSLLAVINGFLRMADRFGQVILG
jgi:hypothetical protein